MPTNALGGQRDQIVAGRPLRVLADSASSSSSLALRDGFEALTAGEVVAPGRNELAMPDEAFLGQVVEDVAAAELVYAAARRSGTGATITL
jgi:hypothetical protein